MYHTSKSIENFSNFGSISSKKDFESSPQIDQLFVNVATEGDEDPAPQSDRFVLENGLIYEGEFTSDRIIQGNGILYSQNNDVIYTGSWRDGKFHGYGTLYNCSYDPSLIVTHRNLDLTQNNWIKYEG